jgi:hypothetical protein
MRRGLDTALDAELLLQVFYPCQGIFKFMPIDNLVPQLVYVGFNSSDSRIKMV